MGNPGDNQVWVMPHLVLPDSKVKDKNTIFVSHFWAVRPVDVSDSPNMKIEWDECTKEGMKVDVPVMRNTIALEAGDKLTVEKYAKKARCN